ARARASTTARAAASSRAECLPVPSSFRVLFPPRTANTAYTVPSSSSRSTPRRAPRRASTTCCAATESGRARMSAMKRLFQLMAEKKASDICLSVKSPINIKINGTAVPVNQQPLESNSILALLYEVLNERQRKEYEQKM